MEVPPKIKTELPHDPEIPVLDTHRKARFQRGRAPGAHLQPQHSGQVSLCEFELSPASRSWVIGLQAETTMLSLFLEYL